MARLPLALLALLPFGLLVVPQPGPAQAAGCKAPNAGRYAVMGMGNRTAAATTTPEARLLEERWLTSGAIEGRISERLGSKSRSGSYGGSVKLVGECLARVERKLPWGQQVSEVVLDGRGRPLYSLDRTPGAVITGRWLPMAPGACRVEALNGVVLSSQVGLSKAKGGWSPNAVVQREQWRDGSVQGVALSSYDGVGSTVGYSGTLKLDTGSCWGTLVEKDSKGVLYNYRALVVQGKRGARGYFYLQSDPSDLTVGWLVRD